MKKLVLIICLILLVLSCEKSNSETETVPEPVISHSSGLYQEVQVVSMHCSMEGAVIHYTIDGTEPSMVSKVFQKPFVVDRSCQIRARAYRSGYSPSPTVQRDLSIDLSDAGNMVLVAFEAGDFLIGRYEVTQTEWDSIMGSNPSCFIGAQRPVETVSYYEVMVYLNKRSLQEGLTPVYNKNGEVNPAYWGAIPTSDDESWNSILVNENANGYRLPKIEEWKHASKGGNLSQAFDYAGNDAIDEVAWFQDNSGQQSHTVGLKQSNESGLWDMSGNVYELVLSNSNQYHNNAIIRGGSWMNSMTNCRLIQGEEAIVPKHSKEGTIGFRVVRRA